ncbi:thiamine-phosphate kinase, partial [Klebsiella pneumoniae]
MLIFDLGHILNTSRCDARFELANLPISEALKACSSPEQALARALAGGEDYELCFTVPEINRGALEMALAHTGEPFCCIGQMNPESDGIRYFSKGEEVKPALSGFD